MRVLMLTVVSSIAVGHGALAQTPLGEVQQIHDGYFELWMANKIRKECPTITPLIFDAHNAISDLKQTARDLGYTDAQIDAYTESEAEKERLRARRAKYFKDRGLKRTEEGYCALGREEIAQNSSIGVLLRQRN